MEEDKLQLIQEKEWFINLVEDCQALVLNIKNM